MSLDRTCYNQMKARLKIDREDHFQRPGFLHIIICVFLGYKVANFVKNWMSPMFKKPQNLKGLTVNLVQGLFRQCSHFFFFAFLLNKTLWIALSYHRINFKIDFNKPW